MGKTTTPATVHVNPITAGSAAADRAFSGTDKPAPPPPPPPKPDGDTAHVNPIERGSNAAPTVEDIRNGAADLVDTGSKKAKETASDTGGWFSRQWDMVKGWFSGFDMNGAQVGGAVIGGGIAALLASMFGPGGWLSLLVMAVFIPIGIFMGSSWGRDSNWMQRNLGNGIGATPSPGATPGQAITPGQDRGTPGFVNTRTSISHVRCDDDILHALQSGSISASSFDHGDPVSPRFGMRAYGTYYSRPPVGFDVWGGAGGGYYGGAPYYERPYAPYYNAGYSGRPYDNGTRPYSPIDNGANTFDPIDNGANSFNPPYAPHPPYQPPGTGSHGPYPPVVTVPPATTAMNIRGR